MTLSCALSRGMQTKFKNMSNKKTVKRQRQQSVIEKKEADR